MGRRGPAPEPTALKVLRGETRPSRINRQEPEPSPNDPEMPDDMAPEAEAVWVRVWREFGQTKVIRAADADIFRLYCEAVARYDYASRLLQESGPLIRGTRGGELVRNLLHGVVRDNALLVRSLAGDLGLSPASRTSLKQTGSGPTGRPPTVLEQLQARRAARLAIRPPAKR